MTTDTQNASVTDITRPPDIATLIPSLIPHAAAAPGNVIGVFLAGGLQFGAAVLDSWAQLYRMAAGIATGDNGRRR